MKILILLLIIGSLMVFGCNQDTKNIMNTYTDNYCSFGSNTGLILVGHYTNLTSSINNVTINNCCCIGRIQEKEFYCMCADLDTLKLVR